MLHFRRELHVDQLLKLLLEKVVGGKGCEARDELRSLFSNVPSIDDRVDDRSVRTGAADTFFLQNANQGCFGVPSGGFGFVARGFDFLAVRLISFRELRKRLVPVLECSFRVIRALDVRPEESWEDDRAAGGAEARSFVSLARLNVRRDESQLRISHLTCDRAFPDQVV